ncbi:hypothetical protein Raf01_46810 [Rugosimonospora africana]|uniref:Uncharacterized protein n=1 Tax=Rugosimonospora africana TaxID=556532 RepID=A0A8J3VRV9_9ACTN|nr:hypothetical protein Raf01_46810 [Rugosimonospora africana]
MTPAEWRVVDAVRHGLTNRQIAARGGVSLDAVKFHVANAVAKLGLDGRAALRSWTGVPAGSAPHRALHRPAVRETTMSGSLSLGAIGQVSRPVGDIDRAVEWYRDVLGLPHLYTYGDLAFFDCGGVRLFLSAESGTAVGEPSVLYFRVDDMHAAYQELRTRGVEFEGAPHLIFRHESGLEEWMAFFKDPDGHLLAIMAQLLADCAAERLS